MRFRCLKCLSSADFIPHLIQRVFGECHSDQRVLKYHFWLKVVHTEKCVSAAKCAQTMRQCKCAHLYITVALYHFNAMTSSNTCHTSCCAGHSIARTSATLLDVHVRNLWQRQSELTWKKSGRHFDLPAQALLKQYHFPRGPDLEWERDLGQCSQRGLRLKVMGSLK